MINQTSREHSGALHIGPGHTGTLPTHDRPDRL
jgi:hypothetical protein